MKNKHIILTIVLLGFSAIIPLYTMHQEGIKEQTWKHSLTLSEPQLDDSGTTLTITIGLKYGVSEGKEVREAIGIAMDKLSKLNAKRKVIKLLPGAYEINKPIIFRKKHIGIEFIGKANAVTNLMDTPIIKDYYKGEILEESHDMPLINGHSVSSFIVVDGVVSDKHLQTSISGFIFHNMMAGIGGTHFPDFSYRLRQTDFQEKGGSYSKFAFRDGGVASVLGNASIVLKGNIFINPSAYQCGGVLRNEQYGKTNIQASIVNKNIVVNPFAWHTGAFVDNAPGSHVIISGNLIILDKEKSHRVDLITNFRKSFMRVQNNRVVDLRSRKVQSPTILIRNIGVDGGAIAIGNKYEGNRESFNLLVSSGVPKFHPGRNMYFYFREDRLMKIIGRLIGRDAVPPGGWPKDIDHLVMQKQFTPPDGDIGTERLKEIFSFKVALLGGKGHFYPNSQVCQPGHC